jgi:hypothetical protein
VQRIQLHLQGSKPRADVVRHRSIVQMAVDVAWRHSIVQVAISGAMIARLWLQTDHAECWHQKTTNTV